MTTQHNDFQQRLDAELNRLAIRIDLFKAKLEVEKANAAADLRSRVADLETRRDELRARLDQLRDASGDAWEAASRGAARAWQELEVAYDDAERTFGKAFESVVSGA